MRYQRSWLSNQPEWELRCWREHTLAATLRREEANNSLRAPVERARILGLEVLWLFGGIYVDTDFESLRCLGPLLEGREFVTADLKPGRVSNALLGAVPGQAMLAAETRLVKERKN
ncbi:MAG: glycosyltransferase [Acidobacteriota bacterium]|nr:glycosyltransferase [Acidobacteriota bacterium]